MNDWVHQHTPWKTFIHSCGSVVALLEDFIEAGFDILNPVQCSAAGMDPRGLKEKFGSRITFWGGGRGDRGQTLTINFTAAARWCKIPPCHEHRASTFPTPCIT